jgi:hypothetical protein
MDATALGQVLDNQLPSWQRSLDVVLLTTPAIGHLTGLQDIIERYQVGEVIDAGMLHPTTTFSLWRRNSSDRNIHSITVAQGATLAIGSQVTLQVLWPGVQLHKSSSEDHDNALVLRLLAPGLRMLLLGATAESRYALRGLLSSVASNYLQASIVDIEGATGQALPAELQEVLQEAAPTLVVITPPTLSAKGRKAQQTTVMAAQQICQVRQVGKWYRRHKLGH